MNCQILDTEDVKLIRSENYNLNFSKKNGFTARWGKTENDDPDYSPWGPEIADIEISSANADDVDKCGPLNVLSEGGCSGIGCKRFCYKANKSNKTVHMSLDMFKAIMDRMPPTLTQIAFGICSIDSNPYLWSIFEETRKRGVVPNVTINGVISPYGAKLLAHHCGAVAVSVNPHNKEVAYDAIKMLSQDNGMDQVNIHIVLAEDTVQFISSVVLDMKTDPRLAKMNAMVMLSFKDKQNTGCFKPITLQSYKNIIEWCDLQGIAYGFDSCSATAYLKTIKDDPDYERKSVMVEPCESGLFSVYINVFGKVSPCSFLENIEWEDGLDLLKFDNLVDLWHGKTMKEWRRKLLACERKCPFYDIGVSYEV